MATRWVNHINPLSWFIRRQGRPVSRGEFATPAEYIKTTQDDYSAADRPVVSDRLEWFAERPEDDDIALTVAPTPTSNPARPRTRAAGYDASTSTLRIEFRDGAVYDYHGVSPDMWQAVQRVPSVGKWINRNLAGANYTRVN